MARRRWALLAVVSLQLVCLQLGASGCGWSATSSAPPTLRVTGAGSAVTLEPWSYCWVNACADGVPPEQVPDVGRAERVEVATSESGLRFTASGEECPRVQPVALGTQANAFPMWPAGPAGTYDVELSAEGGEGRSASYAFRWTTTRAGVAPTPTASVVVLAEDGDAIGTSGVELSVENLRTTPRRALASVVVTSAEGVRTSIKLERPRGLGDCEPAGSIRFHAARSEALPVLASGSEPFRYEVLLVLDGRSYRSSAT